MPHETPLIATIVAGIGLAFIFGALAHRLRLPTLVGYLVAGVLVGPHTPGFVADASLARELAEIGVILLMFGVGLHFSLKDLLAVRAIAVPGALVQIAVAIVMGAALARSLGWPLGAQLLFGFALSVSSTVVLLRALHDQHLVQSERGRIAIGWLVVEDLVMILALVLLPALASVSGSSDASAGDPLAARFGLGIWGVLALTLVKIAAFVAFMLVVGRRVIPWVLHYIAHTGSRELFRLAVLAIGLGVAFGAAKLFGVSLALGAFFAGMILSESKLSQRAAEESLPFRDAFAVLFFVSVGMLFDPESLVRDPLPALATVFIIVVGKSVAAFLIVLAFRRSLGTALIISASLAQIGEFSFILSELGIGLQVLPQQGRDLILAGAILSIALNPLIFAAIDWLQPRLERHGARVAPVDAVALVRPEMAEFAEITASTSLTDHAILVGYGRVGNLVSRSLENAGIPFVVIEDADDIAASLHEKGIKVIIGNAAKPQILKAANLASAQYLIIAAPYGFETGEIVERAKATNPAIKIIARADTHAEAEHLTALGADSVVMAASEIARGIIKFIEGQSHDRDLRRTGT